MQSSSLKTLAVGASVAAIAASFLIGPAAASPELIVQSPIQLNEASPTLVLTVDKKETLLLPESRTLGCDDPAGPTGTHPRPEEACATLARVGGNLANLQGNGTICTMMYAPVTLSAKGQYRGMRIQYQATYSNECVAWSQTEDVFRW